MIIAGLQKNSFVDYPGKIAAVLFCGGCNFDCWYCHNRRILKSGYDVMDEGDVTEFLRKRRGSLDAVVLSGGEACLQPDLADFAVRLKDMGYLVKLDTNGSRPEALREFLRRGLADYIAMDVKAPFGGYAVAGCPDVDEDALRESVSLITGGGAAYEFRTTCIPQLSPDDIGEIARAVSGAELYALQQYRRPDDCPNADALALPPHEKDFFRKAEKLAEKYVRKVVIRGV